MCTPAATQVKAGIPPPSVMARGIKPLTERNSCQAEGKLSSGNHSNNLANTGRGQFLTQKQRVKDSNQQSDGQKDLDHFVSCRAQSIPSFSTANVKNGKNRSQDIVQMKTK